MAWLKELGTITKNLQAAAEQATDVVRSVGLDGHLVVSKHCLVAQHACHVVLLLPRGAAAPR